MILPTRKLLVILLVPAAVLLVWRTPAGVALGLCLDLAILAAALVDLLISAPPRALELTRRVPPFLSLGAENAVGWDVRNRSGQPVSFELCDDLAEGLERDLRRVAGRIPARARAEIRYRVRPTARGLYEFGDVHLRCGTLLGLCVRQRRLAMRSAVKVYPNVTNLARYELTLQRHRAADLGLRSVRMRDKGSQFESLREYALGDDLADVAWKATARRGRMIVRNYEAERSQNVLLVLDCGRLMTTEVDGLSRLDCAVNASILMTYVAMKQGDWVGLLAFSDKVESYVPPVRGKAAVRRANEALYRLTPSLAESNFDLAGRFLALRYRKRSLIIVFTDVLGRESSAALLAHAARFARQHVVLCVTLRNREVESFAGAEPQQPFDCFTKTMALGLLERRREALHCMRRSGVDVLDVSPQTLTPNVVSRYLWLKRNRRI